METEVPCLLSKRNIPSQGQSLEADDDWVKIPLEPEVKYNKNGFQALKYGIFVDEFKQSGDKQAYLQQFLATMKEQSVEDWINFLLIIKIEADKPDSEITDLDCEMIFEAIDVSVKEQIQQFKRIGLTEKENFFFVYSILSKKMKVSWFNQHRGLLNSDIENPENFFQMYDRLHAEQQHALTEMLVAGKIKNKMIMLTSFSSDRFNEIDQEMVWRKHTFSGDDLKPLEFIAGACDKIKNREIRHKFWAYSFTFLQEYHPLLKGVEKYFSSKPSIDNFLAEFQKLETPEKKSFIAGLKDDTSAFHQTVKHYLQKRPKNSIVQPADWASSIKQLAESLEAKLTTRSFKENR